MHLAAFNPFSFISKVGTGVQNVANRALEGAVAYKNIQSVLKAPAAPAYSLYSPTGAQPFTPFATPQQADANRKLTASELRSLQTALKSRGYDPGPIDGIFGPRTSSAILAYQRANGLPADGQATLSVYNHVTGANQQIPIAQITPPPVTQPGWPSPIAFPWNPAPFPSAQAPAPSAPAPTAGGLPSWALPAGIAAVGVVLALALGGRGRGR